VGDANRSYVWALLENRQMAKGGSLRRFRALPDLMTAFPT